MTSAWISELLYWFRSEKATTRLDVLIAFLQMLHPLELRFIGNFVDELTRRDYDCLRNCERRYNSENIGADFNDLTNPRCRCKLLVALCLLRSGNHGTADILYKSVMTLDTVFPKLPKCKEVTDEVLLLLSIARRHPAFKFDQYLDIEELSKKITRLSKVPDGCGDRSGETRCDPPPLPSGSAAGDNNNNISSVLTAAGKADPPTVTY